MTPAEILAEARRWNVDISPSDARILNFASWVRAMALEEAAKECLEIEARFDSRQQYERSYGAFECKVKLSYLVNKEPK